jgi:hypothetical protein
MPVSTDNQDYNNAENKGNEEKKSEVNGPGGSDQKNSSPESKNDFTSDNLKGKKIDADVEKETDKPADI